MSKNTSFYLIFLFMFIFMMLLKSFGTNALPDESQDIVLNYASPIDGFSVQYYENKIYNFVTNWNLTNNLTSLNILHNFSGESKTEQVNNFSNGEGVFLVYDLSVGNYYWKMSLDDSKGNSFNTSEFLFTVIKSEPNFTLNLSSNKVLESDLVKISGNLLEGEGDINLFINDNLVMNNSKSINFSTILPVGLNNISLIYNETENYSLKEVQSQVLVEEIPFSLEINKNEYDLKEVGFFVIKTLDNVNVSTTIYGPGCNTDLWVLTRNTNQKEGSLSTNNTGSYCINSSISYKNLTKNKSVMYDVLNSMEIRVQGETTFQPGTKSNLVVEAKGGFEPYTYKWIDEDGWDISLGNKFEETFTNTGTYKINILAEDNKGNKKTHPIDIEVLRIYKLKVEVKDADSGAALRNSEVRFGDEIGYTNNNGILEISNYEGSRKLTVGHPEYLTESKTIELSGNQDVVVNLDKRSAVSNTYTSTSKIIIINPTLNEELNNNNVNFEAEINPSSLSICKFYISKDGDVWYEELSSFSMSNSKRVNFTKELSPGDYTWRVECSEKNSLYSSNEVSFSILGSAKATTLDSSVNAGDIRQKLENARDNLNSLSFEDQKSAAALNLSESLRIAIRDFDRNVRDINSMQHRRDLTQEEVESNLKKYADNINTIEKETPKNIKTIDSKLFIDYPDIEVVKAISKEYMSERKIEGSINSKQLEYLQNKIEVRTQVLLSEIEYLSGVKKEITIVSKTINYKDNITNGFFLLEKLPSDINLRAQDVTFLQNHEIIKQNPLILFNIEDSITYYFKDHINLEKSINFTTIILNDPVFSDSIKNNMFTGLVTGLQFDLGTPFWSILVLLVLLITYIFHSFDIGNRLLSFLTGKRIKTQIHKLNILINDSQDYLDSGDMDKANLIFKELKYNFEKSCEKARIETYNSALKLHDNIDLSFLKNLIEKITVEINTKDKSRTISNYNVLIKNYQNLPKELKLLIENEMGALQSTLTAKYPELNIK